jgi:hypothetical protein
VTRATVNKAILGEVPGRALHVGADGSILVADRHRVRCSSDWGRTWRLDCTIPTRRWQAAVTATSLAARLLRHYIAALRVLSDGTRVCVARGGVYRAGPGEIEMRRVFAITRGSRPLSLTVDPDDRVLFGEYGGNAERHEVHVYCSDPGARRFDVLHTFPAGDVRHVHNVIYDRYCDKHWVFVGDYGHEPGIALLDRDGSALQWVARDGQETRAAAAIVEPDGLLYGTDTELEPNWIVRLDRKTGRRERLCCIEGSSLFATRFGDVRLVSTCVEPSGLNRSRSANLHASTDGERWSVVDSCPKDLWSLKYFQYGLIVLPHSDFAAARGIYSGQAVRHLDNRTRIATFEGGGP